MDMELHSQNNVDIKTRRYLQSDKGKATIRRYRRTEKYRFAARQWQKKALQRPEYQRSRQNSYLKYRYGITLAEYEVMLAQQGNKCAICFSPPNGRSLDVDHNHITGQIRNLLCSPCNRQHVGRGLTHARAVVAYLERWKAER